MVAADHGEFISYFRRYLIEFFSDYNLQVDIASHLPNFFFMMSQIILFQLNLNSHTKGHWHNI